MQQNDLARSLNQLLQCDRFSDYAPNGLQVVGTPEVKKIITGVTASQWLIDRAIIEQADAILVHHGYFWKNEDPVIQGIKRHRLKALLTHDINLYAYHLPLDAHPLLGNNAQLGQLLEFDFTAPEQPTQLLYQGELKNKMTPQQLQQHLNNKLQRSILHCGETGPSYIKRVAWVTGGGQGFIEDAIALGVDAFLTGEVSEQTIHIARESGIHFFACGHHATERYGIRALGEWLAQEYHLDVHFIDLDNPA